MLFERAWVNTHGTPPSHATMLTGLHQQSHQVSFPGADGKPNHTLARELETLPESLAGLGYETIAVTGGGYVSKSHGFEQGFNRWREQPGTSVRRSAKTLIGILEKVLEKQAQDGVEQPIFAFFHTYEIHSPYEAPERFHGAFGEVSSQFEASSENLLRYVDRADALAPEELESIITHYDEGLRFADEVIGWMLESLAELGFLDNTVVTVTSDHGEEFGERGSLLHGGTLFDELTRIPLILSGPGIEASRVDRTVSHVDLYPTLVALAEESRRST